MTLCDFVEHEHRVFDLDSTQTTQHHQSHTMHTVRGYISLVVN